MDPASPQRFATPDVAQAGHDALIEQDVAHGRGRVDNLEPAHEIGGVVAPQDVWPEGTQAWHHPQVPRRHEAHHRRVEAHGLVISRLEYEAHGAGRVPPPLADHIGAPGAGHPHMGVHNKIAGEDKKVLGPGLHVIDRAAHELGGASIQRNVAGFDGGDGATNEPRPQPSRGAGDRVTFGHL